MSTTTTLSKEEINDYIIANYETKSNAEMAKELGFVNSIGEPNTKYVSAQATWLSRESKINLGLSKRSRDNWVKEWAKEERLAERKKKEKVKKAKAKKVGIVNHGTINHGTINHITNIFNDLTEEIDGIIGKYKNGNGKNKLHAKEKMQNHIIGTGIQGHIVTLTNVHTEMEEAIFKALPNTTYTAVESELPIFEQMQLLFPSRNLPMKLHHGLMSDMIYGKDENSYAHMILDYCLDLTQHAKEIEYTIDNNLVGVGGIIALTTNKSNRRGSGEMWDYITGLSDEATINRRKDNRCKTEIENERFLYSILGRNYKIIEVFSYHDRYPMTLTIIKRIK